MDETRLKEKDKAGERKRTKRQIKKEFIKQRKKEGKKAHAKERKELADRDFAAFMSMLRQVIVIINKVSSTPRT